MDLERILIAGLCLIATLSGACAASLDPSDAASEQAIAAPDMRAFWSAHVADRQRGDVEAATSVLAEDCQLIEPFRPPLSGRDNIASKMRQDQAMVETHRVSIDSLEVHHDGSWLVDFGTFSETFSLAGEEPRYLVEGSYTAWLERDAGGDWKVKRFMALPNTPPPSL